MVLPSLLDLPLNLDPNGFRAAAHLDPVEVFGALDELTRSVVLVKLLLADAEDPTQEVLEGATRQVLVERESVDPMLVVIGERAGTILVAARCLDILQQVIENVFDRETVRIHEPF